mmetsp:Transcript_59927/g.195718  ORF Transcript_59927/g.195718 Transcript_59927/m.195718 type:complete len:111 (-) Transcript_59927:482-814(-)
MCHFACTGPTLPQAKKKSTVYSQHTKHTQHTQHSQFFLVFAGPPRSERLRRSPHLPCAAVPPPALPPPVHGVERMRDRGWLQRRWWLQRFAWPPSVPSPGCPPPSFRPRR